MLKIDDLVGVTFEGLSALAIEDVRDESDLIRVMARTRGEPVPCPVCGALTGRAHGYAGPTVTDVPVDGRRVVVSAACTPPASTRASTRWRTSRSSPWPPPAVSASWPSSTPSARPTWTGPAAGRRRCRDR